MVKLSIAGVAVSCLYIAQLGWSEAGEVGVALRWVSLTQVGIELFPFMTDQKAAIACYDLAMGLGGQVLNQGMVVGVKGGVGKQAASSEVADVEA